VKFVINQSIFLLNKVDILYYEFNKFLQIYKEKFVSNMLPLIKKLILVYILT